MLGTCLFFWLPHVPAKRRHSNHRCDNCNHLPIVQTWFCQCANFWCLLRGYGHQPQRAGINDALWWQRTKGTWLHEHQFIADMAAAMDRHLETVFWAAIQLFSLCMVEQATDFFISNFITCCQWFNAWSDEPWQTLCPPQAECHYSLNTTEVLSLTIEKARHWAGYFVFNVMIN